MKVQRKIWWSLQWPNGALDIDADNMLHLYTTKKRAQEEAEAFEGPKPLPVKIRLGIEEARCAEPGCENTVRPKLPRFCMEHR